MFRLAAIFIVALAVSPFTAPFQTYDPSPTTLHVPIEDDTPSVVAPLRTEAGRLTLVVPAALGTSCVVAAPAATLGRVRIARRCDSGDRSASVIVLRI